MKFEVYPCRTLLGRREWRWRLKAANGRKIAHSGESYRNQADALHAIELVREAGRTAAVKGL